MTKDEFQNSISNNLFPVINDSVYDYILSLIIEHRFEPGEKINMTKISNDLEVSRTPVRNALDKLASEGLIAKIDQKGFFTCKIEWDDCLDLYRTRQLIEGTAAYYTAMNIKPEGLARLEEILTITKKHRENGNRLESLKDDFNFHRTIVELSNCHHLLIAYDSISTWIRLYQHLISSYQVQQYRGLEMHYLIYKAIKNHYPTEAKSLAEGHIQDIIYTLAGLISKKL